MYFFELTENQLLTRILHAFMTTKNGEMETIEREIFEFEIRVQELKNRETLSFSVSYDKSVEKQVFKRTCTGLFKRFASEFTLKFRSPEFVLVRYKDPASQFGDEIEHSMDLKDIFQ